MTTKISFRAQRVDNSNWVYGFYWEDMDGNPYIVSRQGKQYPVIRETVGQFSGVLTGKGKSLYAGDTVKVSTDGGEIQGIVMFKDGFFGLEVDGEVVDVLGMIEKDKLKFVK
jgi:hypothetical protein